MALDDRIVEAEQDLKKLREDIVFEETGIPAEEMFINYEVKCSESPIGYCVFDNSVDKNHKDCIYCGSGRCDWDLPRDNEIVKEEE